MKRVLVLMFLFTVLAWAAVSHAQTVAIYNVDWKGLHLNQGDQDELGRLVAQACYDEGFKCAYRGTANYKKEGGSQSNADYVAEFTITGKTREKFNVGTKGSGLKVFGGYGAKVGGAIAGVGGSSALSGLSFGGDSFTVTGQITDKSGYLAYSGTKSKLSFRGQLILAETRSENTKKLVNVFKEMFREFKGRNK